MGIFKKSTKNAKEMKIIPDEAEPLREYAKEEALPAQPEEAYGELALDIFQNEKEVVIVAPVAGVKRKDLSILISEEHDKILEIRGNRRIEFNVNSSEYVAKECFWGPFRRHIILPDSALLSGVTASFKDGVLTIRVPKSERIEARVVEIKEHD